MVKHLKVQTFCLLDDKTEGKMSTDREQEGDDFSHMAFPAIPRHQDY